MEDKGNRVEIKFVPNFEIKFFTVAEKETVLEKFTRCTEVFIPHPGRKKESH